MTCKDCLHYEACLAANATFRLQLDFERGATCCYSFVPASDWKKVEHGHWIWNEREMEYECSSCHMTFDYEKTYELFDRDFPLANYCSYCGAKMDL